MRDTDLTEKEGKPAREEMPPERVASNEELDIK